MRKNSPRKWLHACLDLLPVILIPVFMIYSHRHEINDGSIQVQKQVAIDFNQQLGEPIESNFYTWHDTYITFDDSGYTGQIVFSYNLVGLDNHIVYFKVYRSDTFVSPGPTYQVYWQSSNSSYYGVPYSSDYYYGTYSNPTGNIQLRVYDSDIVGKSMSFQFFDLTQMFGSGNEPSRQEFDLMFTDNYYEYTLSHQELIDDGLVVYNDTDIMSQFTYQLYNAVYKYFNMGNVFNMTSVYDWFNLNIFGGNAPISIYIVWNIVLYEFVMDLLFLLYGLFMWFIDIVQHLMEKPLNSVK